MSHRLESLRRFVGELSRRRVFRTAALYLIVAVVVVEGTEALIAPLGLPLRTLSMVSWAAILGFPIAVGLAWTFDVTPRGIVRTPPDSEEDRVRRKISAQIGLRLTLTGVTAAVVGATTWVIMEPFLPRLPEPLPPTVVEAPPPDEVLVVPVVVGSDVNGDTGSRATRLILQNLSDVPGLRPVDPSRVNGLPVGRDDVTEVARQLGVRRVLEARLEPAPEGVVLTASLRDVEGGGVEVSATAAGPPEELEELVSSVVGALSASSGGEPASSRE